MSASIIEAAKSSRSKCGGCKKKIEKDELRYGDYNEQWDSYKWFHLPCGAAHNQAGFMDAVESFEGDIPDVEAILEKAKQVGKGTKTPRVEVAPSDRSSCIVCEKKIEPKGVLRGVVMREVEIDTWRKGFTHVGCMSEVVEMDRDDLIDLVIEQSLLTEDQVEEVVNAL